MNRILYLSFLFWLAVTAGWAQGPNGTGRYYLLANGKSGARLKTALCEIIRNPKFSSTQKEEGQGYNREQLLPQSWFGSKTGPMYSDIMHVVPVDCKLNTLRSDNPFGEVTDKTAQVSTSKNGYKTSGQLVIEAEEKLKI